MLTPTNTITSEPPARHSAGTLPDRTRIPASVPRPSLLRTQAARYLSTLLWISRHGFSRFRSQSILIVLLMIAGLGIGWLSLGGLMLYARQLSRADPLVIAGQAVNLTHPSVFIPFSVLLALLGVLSASLLYLAERRIALVTRDFERALVDQIESLIRDPWCRGWQDLLERPLRSALNRLLRIGARWTAFSYRELLRGVLYGGIVLLGVITMLLVDVALTLCLLPLAAIYVIPLYFINRGVSRCHRQYSTADRDARGTFASFVKQSLQEGWLKQDSDGQARRKVFDDLWSAQALFYDRILFVRRTALVNGIFFMGILCILFVYFGIATGNGTATWGHFFVYLVALRFAWSGIQQISTLCTNISRFMAEYEMYRDFNMQCNRLRDRRRNANPHADLPNVLRLTMRSEPVWSDTRSTLYQRGKVLFVLIPERPDHAELEAAVSRMGRCLPASVTITPTARIVAATTLDPTISLAANALGERAGPDERERLELLVELLHLQDEIAALSDGLDTIVQEHPELSVSHGLELAITLARDIITPPPVIAVSALITRGVPAPLVRRLLHRLRRSYLIVVHDTPSALLHHRWRWAMGRAAATVVTDQASVRAILDEGALRSHIVEVEHFLSSLRSGDQSPADNPDDEL